MQGCAFGAGPHYFQDADLRAADPNIGFDASGVRGSSSGVLYRPHALSAASGWG
jgi:hypothetical protein